MGLPKRSGFHTIGKNKATTWYQIEYLGTKAWVYANYVTIGH